MSFWNHPDVGRYLTGLALIFLCYMTFIASPSPQYARQQQTITTAKKTITPVITPSPLQPSATAPSFSLPFSSTATFSSPSFVPRCPLVPQYLITDLIVPRAEQTILITGGAGYIGSTMALLLLKLRAQERIQELKMNLPNLPSHLFAALTQQSFNLVVVDDLSRGSAENIQTLEKVALTYNKSFKFFQTSVKDTERLKTIMKEEQVNVVIHFAAFAYSSESVVSPLKYYENNVHSMQSLLEAMEAADVSRLIFSSSSAVYGNAPEGCHLHEYSAKTPLSPYGQSKLWGEDMIEAHANARHLAGKPFSYVNLRYFNVIGVDRELLVGPRPRPDFSNYARILDTCLEVAWDVSHGTDRSLRVYGSDYNTPDGTAIRDYVHVSDLVSAHLTAMLVLWGGDGRQIRTYNVGVGKGTSVAEMAATCSRKTNVDVKVEYKPRRHGDPSTVIGDAKRIKTEIYWEPRFLTLDDAVSSQWKWLQKVKTETTSVTTTPAKPSSKASSSTKSNTARTSPNVIPSPSLPSTPSSRPSSPSVETPTDDEHHHVVPADAKTASVQPGAVPHAPKASSKTTSGTSTGTALSQSSKKAQSKQPTTITPKQEFSNSSPTDQLELSSEVITNSNNSAKGRLHKKNLPIPTSDPETIEPEWASEQPTSTPVSSPDKTEVTNTKVEDQEDSIDADE